jgi:hypothetical protein
MKSYLHAYEAYERQVMLGAFGHYPKAKNARRADRFSALLLALGDLLIRLGTGLKQRQAAGRAMHLSPLSGHDK